MVRSEYGKELYVYYTVIDKCKKEKDKGII